MWVLVKLSKQQAQELKSQASARNCSVYSLGGCILGQYLAGRLVRSKGVGSAALSNGMIDQPGPGSDIAALSKRVFKNSASKIVIAPCGSVGKPEGQL